MTKALKRLATAMLALAMAVASLLVLGTREAYAASGETRDCEWVTTAIFGRPNGYAVAGSTIHMVPSDLDYMKDEDGSNVASPLSSFDKSYIDVGIYYAGPGGTERIGGGAADVEFIDAMVPADAPMGSTIYASAKGPDGWYYYGTQIPVKPAQVDGDIMEDRGAVTITLPETGYEEALPASIDAAVLRNSFLIAGDAGMTKTDDKTESTIDVDIDANNILDMYLSIEGGQGIVLNGNADQYNLGTSSMTISIPVGTPFDPQNLFEDVYLQRRVPYYSSVTIKIPPRDISTPTKLVLSKTALTYNGKAQAPKVKTLEVNWDTLSAGTDYQVKGSRKDVGKGTLTITGRGIYGGTFKETFTINPKGTRIAGLTKASRAVTVRWKRQAKKMSKLRITGYQVQLATDSAFTKNEKTVTAKGYQTTSKKVTRLQGGKKYYVRVRTYMKVGGKKYYSTWSKAKTVTTKK